MARILVIVEGETEETFVKELLAPHLVSFGHYASARLMGNARLRLRRGGIRGWDAASQDILNHLRSDPTIFVTTMVDYYALPQIGPNGWPGRAAANSRAFVEKAAIIQRALRTDIAKRLGVAESQTRFVPYIMMHEFEALLFSDCPRFASGIGQEHLASAFQAVRDQFATPEEINDSPLTAPSKRVITLVQSYTKLFHGNLAALEIGLGPIRRECPFFDAWLSELESLL